MPSRQQTIADAIKVFSSAIHPSRLNSSIAWLGIYQTLLWYEPINMLGFTSLPHIIDADKLRPASKAKQRVWRKASAWQQRAQALNDYLTQQLGCPANQVVNKMDQLMKQPGYRGMQRQNTLGTAFTGIIKYVLEKLGASSIAYELEMQADKVFSGITFPGRSSTPRIDILARVNNLPRAIISAKWSVRHDRLGDITNECPVYKSAYQSIYRQSGRGSLLYYVVTNEYDPARLNKILADPCIDGVVHVHKPAVITVCGLDGRLVKLMDLTDLIDATGSW